MVELLLSKGANVNTQSENGKTALMLASFAGKLNIIKELRSYNAELNIKDSAGLTALHYAVDGANLDAIKFILMEKADVNARDNNGWSPLLRAASTNASKEIAELLCKFKSNVNILDNDHKSALMTAVVNGNQPFVQVLVENGADLTLKNDFGRTAYDLAVSMDRRKVVKYLAEYFEKNK
jgi:ankyrin repeat protein